MVFTEIKKDQIRRRADQTGSGWESQDKRRFKRGSKNQRSLPGFFSRGTRRFGCIRDGAQDFPGVFGFGLIAGHPAVFGVILIRKADFAERIVNIFQRLFLEFLSGLPLSCGGIEFCFEQYQFPISRADTTATSLPSSTGRIFWQMTLLPRPLIPTSSSPLPLLSLSQSAISS